MTRTSTNVDFVGIGAPRCGTTWLGNVLSEHPEICMAKHKESGAFINNDKYNSLHKTLTSEFEGCSSNQKKGMFPPRYYIYSHVAERLIGHNPNIKILISLRHPVDRAYSHYISEKTSRGSQYKSFEEAIQDPESLVYLYGLYYRHLSAFLKHIPSQNILFIFYDDIENKPQEVAHRLYTFLGVNSDHQPTPLHEKVNPAGKRATRFPWLSKLIKNRGFVKKYWWGRICVSVLRTLRLNKITSDAIMRISAWNKNPGGKIEYPPLKQEDRKQLFEYYKEDIESLEKFTGISLQHWIPE